MSGSYISTGTMGDIWLRANCERCTKDHPWHSEYSTDEQCPVLIALLIHEYPIEGLIRHDDSRWPDALECTYFTPCGCEP